jgi:ribonuclease-3
MRLKRNHIHPNTECTSILPEDQVYDYSDNPRWQCEFTIRGHSVEETAYATSKKTAKKYAAYLCICNICGLKDQYEDRDN